MSDRSSNPYQSPVSEGELQPRRRTRWRIIPVTLLAIYGSAGIGSVPVMVVIVAGTPPEYGGGFTLSRIIGFAMLFLSSFGFVGSAIVCWQGRWLRFVIVLTISLVLMFASQPMVNMEAIDGI